MKSKTIKNIFIGSTVGVAAAAVGTPFIISAINYSSNGKINYDKEKVEIRKELLSGLNILPMNERDLPDDTLVGKYEKNLKDSYIKRARAYSLYIEYVYKLLPMYGLISDFMNVPSHFESIDMFNAQIQKARNALNQSDTKELSFALFGDETPGGIKTEVEYVGDKNSSKQLSFPNHRLFKRHYETKRSYIVDGFDFVSMEDLISSIVKGNKNPGDIEAIGEKTYAIKYINNMLDIMQGVSPRNEVNPAKVATTDSSIISFVKNKIDNSEKAKEEWYKNFMSEFNFRLSNISDNFKFSLDGSESEIERQIDIDGVAPLKTSDTREAYKIYLDTKNKKDNLHDAMEDFENDPIIGNVIENWDFIRILFNLDKVTSSSVNANGPGSSILSTGFNFKASDLANGKNLISSFDSIVNFIINAQSILIFDKGNPGHVDTLKPISFMTELNGEISKTLDGRSDDIRETFDEISQEKIQMNNSIFYIGFDFNRIMNVINKYELSDDFDFVIPSYNQKTITVGMMKEIAKLTKDDKGNKVATIPGEFMTFGKFIYPLDNKKWTIRSGETMSIKNISFNSNAVLSGQEDNIKDSYGFKPKWSIDEDGVETKLFLNWEDVDSEGKVGL